MKKKFVWILIMALFLTSTAACSSAPREAEDTPGTSIESESAWTDITEGDQGESADAGNEEEESSTEPAVGEDIEGDPIIGIVESYADNIIAIEDEGDGIIYYFSTENALAAGEDASITVGDRVQITYQGGLGDEEHPGRAVKIETAFQ